METITGTPEGAKSVIPPVDGLGEALSSTQTPEDFAYTRFRGDSKKIHIFLKSMEVDCGYLPTQACDLEELERVAKFVEEKLDQVY